MRLVVAGLGRTGTQSLVVALEQLGLRTVSLRDLFSETEQLSALIAAARGEAPFDDAILEGADASVGWPLCWLYAEQLQRWPEARCLLNVRDADAWFDSVSRAWRVLGPLRRLRLNARLRTLDALLSLLEERMGGPLDRPRWTAGYRAHVEEVRRSVPPDRLQIYELGAGWAPICELLDLPIPDAPFPRGNSSKNDEFRDKVRQLLFR